MLLSPAVPFLNSGGLEARSDRASPDVLSKAWRPWVNILPSENVLSRIGPSSILVI